MYLESLSIGEVSSRRKSLSLTASVVSTEDSVSREEERSLRSSSNRSRSGVAAGGSAGVGVGVGEGEELWLGGCVSCVLLDLLVCFLDEE